MRPYFQDESVTIYHGDCREVLPSLSGTDLVLTDPPYVFGIASTSQEGKSGGWGDLMNAAAWYALILKECHRLTVNRQGAAWIFNSWRSFPVLARAAYEAQWPVTSLMVWDKEAIGPGGIQGLRPTYEQIALFCQKEFAIPNRSIPDVIRSKWASIKPNGHPAEKPIELTKKILQISGMPSTVLDPFMGSGTTLRAAKDLGVKAVGIEIEERWCEVAANRMAQSVLRDSCSETHVATSDGPLTLPTER